MAKCMTEYCSTECNKPDNKKLVWIISKKTAQNLQCCHYSVPGLPTIPEGSWDERLKCSICFFFCYSTFSYWINMVTDEEILSRQQFFFLMEAKWLHADLILNFNVFINT